MGQYVSFLYRPGDTVRVHQDSRIGNGLAIPAGVGLVGSIEWDNETHLYMLKVNMPIEQRTVLVQPSGVDFQLPSGAASVEDGADGRSLKRQKTRVQTHESESRARDFEQAARIRELERQVEALNQKVCNLEASRSSEHARAKWRQQMLKAQLTEQTRRRAAAEEQSRLHHSSLARSQREVHQLQSRITGYEHREEEFLEAVGRMDLEARLKKQNAADAIRAMKTKVWQLRDQLSKRAAGLKQALRESREKDQRAEQLEEQVDMLLEEHAAQGGAMQDLETQLLGALEDKVALEKQLQQLSEAAGAQWAHAHQHRDLLDLCRVLLSPEELKSLGVSKMQGDRRTATQMLSLLLTVKGAAQSEVMELCSYTDPVGQPDQDVWVLASVLGPIRGRKVRGKLVSVDTARRHCIVNVGAQRHRVALDLVRSTKTVLCTFLPHPSSPEPCGREIPRCAGATDGAHARAPGPCTGSVSRRLAHSCGRL